MHLYAAVQYIHVSAYVIGLRRCFFCGTWLGGSAFATYAALPGCPGDHDTRDQQDRAALRGGGLSAEGRHDEPGAARSPRIGPAPESRPYISCMRCSVLLQMVQTLNVII